jgi:hypothetical protein
MGYRDRTINFDFSVLGDGCFVTMTNPKLLRSEQMESPEDIKVDRFGMPLTPIDEAKARRNGMRILALLIVDWCVWDIDTDEPLPVPTAEDFSALDRIPVAIFKPLMNEVGDALNPTVEVPDGVPNVESAAATS